MRAGSARSTSESINVCQRYGPGEGQSAKGAIAHFTKASVHSLNSLVARRRSERMSFSSPARCAALRISVACHGRMALGNDDPLVRFDVVFHHTVAIVIGDRQVVERACAALLGRFAPPLHGLCRVPRDTLAVLVHEPQIRLRLSVPLLRGFAIPLECLCEVLRRTLPVMKSLPEMILREGVALIR